jgi:hypothetical protein
VTQDRDWRVVDSSTILWLGSALRIPCAEFQLELLTVQFPITALKPTVFSGTTVSPLAPEQLSFGAHFQQFL